VSSAAEKFLLVLLLLPLFSSTPSKPVCHSERSEEPPHLHLLLLLLLLLLFAATGPKAVGV
jgi:hypothetical protein